MGYFALDKNKYVESVGTEYNSAGPYLITIDTPLYLLANFSAYDCYTEMLDVTILELAVLKFAFGCIFVVYLHYIVIFGCAVKPLTNVKYLS